MSFAIEEVRGKASNLLKNKAFLMIAAGVGVVALIAGRRRSQDQTATDTAEVAFADYPQAPANYQQDLEQYKTVIENEMSQAFSELWNQVQQSQSDLQNQVKQSQADLQNQTAQQLQQLASSFQSSLADIQQHSTLNGSTLTQTIQDLQSSYQSSLQSAVQNMVEQNKALMEQVIDNAAPKQTQSQPVYTTQPAIPSGTLTTGSFANKSEANEVYKKLVNDYGAKTARVEQVNGRWVVNATFESVERADKVNNRLQQLNVIQVGHVGAQTKK